MKKRNLLIFVIVALLSINLVACSGGGEDEVANEEGVHLVIAHNQTSTENPYHYGMLKFKEEIEKISDGEITVEVHNGSIGTNEPELVEKLSLRAADMIVVSPGFMTGIGVNEVDLLSVPYLFDSFEHWENSMDGEFGSKIQEIITEKTNNEFKVMDYWSAGVRNYYGTRPLESPEDADGIKIRTQNSQVQQEFWESMGAIPSSVDWNELFQALQQGVVTAAENDYTNFMQQDHHKTEHGKYITETEHDYTTRLLLMNGERFDELTEEQQELILQAIEVATEEERNVTYRMLDESKEKVISDGGMVNEVDKTGFLELARPIQDRFAEENDMTDLLEMTRENK